MKIMIPFINPKTGEIKHVKLGFSWTVFIMNNWLPIPLYMRKLYFWAIFITVLTLVIILYFPFILFNLPWLIFLSLGIDIYISLHVNKLTAIKLLEDGWQFYEPNSEHTRTAKVRWGIAGTSSASDSGSDTSQHVPPPPQHPIPKGKSKLKKVLIALILVPLLFIGGIYLSNLGVQTIDHADHNDTGNSANADPPNDSDSGWKLAQEQDQLTDRTTLTATKIYPVDNGGQIQAVASCDGIGGVPDIDFTFNLFNDDKQYEAYETYDNAVAVQYRLDNGEVQMQPSGQKYQNVAMLIFFDQQRKFTNQPTTMQEFLKSSLLRVRLPVVGGVTADIAIQLSDLHEFLEACLPKIAKQAAIDKAKEKKPAGFTPTKGDNGFGTYFGVRSYDTHGIFNNH